MQSQCRIGFYYLLTHLLTLPYFNKDSGIDVAEVVVDENGNVEVPINHPSNDHAYSSVVPLLDRPSEQSLMRVSSLNYKFLTSYIKFYLLGK